MGRRRGTIGAAVVALLLAGCGGGGSNDKSTVNPAKPLMDTTYCGKVGQQQLNSARKAIPVFEHRISKGVEVTMNEKALHEAEESREAQLEICAVKLELQEDRPDLVRELEARCAEYNTDEHAIFEALAESGNTQATLERLPEYRVVCAER